MQDKPLRGCRVLVIEDDYFIADALEQVLTKSGAEVVGPLPDVARALAELRSDGIHVAVVDINLHGEMSYPAADELKRQNIPFVFATAYMRQDLPPRFADVEVWEKPYELRIVVESVGRLCLQRSNC